MFKKPFSPKRATWNLELGTWNPEPLTRNALA